MPSDEKEYTGQFSQQPRAKTCLCNNINRPFVHDADCPLHEISMKPHAQIPSDTSLVRRLEALNPPDAHQWGLMREAAQALRERDKALAAIEKATRISFDSGLHVGLHDIIFQITRTLSKEP